MSEIFNGEHLLLRNQSSEALGYFNPFYNSILIPAAKFNPQVGDYWATLFHEKTHWSQFNLSPWGVFLQYLYEAYVGLSEDLLVRVREERGRIDKPLWIFIQDGEGSLRDRDKSFNEICNDHITALDALPLLFHGSDAVETQALDDAIRTMSYYAFSPQNRDSLLEEVPFPSLAVETVSGVPSWRSLLETWARSTELLATVRNNLRDLDRTGVPLEVIAPDEYGDLFPIFLEHSGLGGHRMNEIIHYSMLAVCAVALQSPVHAGFGDHWGTLTNWSDVRPETRFIKAARALRAIGPIEELEPENQLQHEMTVGTFMDRICDHLGWPKAGELAYGFQQRCEDAVVIPGQFSAGYLAAAPLIRRDPSLLAFGPCHSNWNELELRIGDVPVFVDPLLSMRVPGPTAKQDLDHRAYHQILTGVKFNLYNEILFEDSFNQFNIDAFQDADWVEDQTTRSIADQLFISPVLDQLEERGIHISDILQWDFYTIGPDGKKKIVLVKSAMRWDDTGQLLERKSHPWQFAINGQKRNHKPMGSA